MKRLDKERRKLEKVGFSGQTLERAMELLERTNASILSELLVKMVTRQEKRPPWRCTRWRPKRGNWRPNWDSRPRSHSKHQQNKAAGSRQMCLLPAAFLCRSVPQIGGPVEDPPRPGVQFKLVLHAVQEQLPFVTSPAVAGLFPDRYVRRTGAGTLPATMEVASSAVTGLPSRASSHSSSTS